MELACESSNELWASVQNNYLRHPMVSPDLFKERSSGALGIDGGVCRDDVCVLGYTVGDVHDCVIAMGFRQFDYEVHTDHIPWCLRCL
jgi:hypothetical protein